MREYFQNKVAVVTGAASGFGLGFSERLLSYGVDGVWMGDFDERALFREAERLQSEYPGKVHPVRADSMKREDIENLINRAISENGRIDFLFNNAGRPKTSPTELISADEFEDVIRLNYIGVVYGVLAALPHMLSQGGGHIINTASCGGLLPAPYQACYASTKAAVISLTRCLSYEYHDTGLYFSQISPMNVATNIFSVETKRRLQSEGLSAEEIEKRLGAIKPPPGAMPLNAALDYVFDGVEKKDVDIVFGQDGRDMYHLLCTDREKYDEFALRIGSARRAFYEAKARGENPVFPG